MSALLTAGRHRLSVADLVAEGVVVLDPAEKADAIYSDPPWGEGALRMFATHNGGLGCRDWRAFLAALAEVCAARIRPGGTVWLETGTRWEGDVVAAMEVQGFARAARVVTRYAGGPALLFAFALDGAAVIPSVPDGLSGVRLVRAALQPLAPGAVVFDPCCGLGMTARACLDYGLRFAGQELNPKRAGRTAALLEARCSARS